MKLLFENWRQYLKENDDDEDNYDEYEHEDSWEDGGPPRTPVQKIVSLVEGGEENNIMQARNLVQSGVVNIEDVIGVMLARYVKAIATKKRTSANWNAHWNEVRAAIDKESRFLKPIIRFIIGGRGETGWGANADFMYYDLIRFADRVPNVVMPEAGGHFARPLKPGEVPFERYDQPLALPHQSDIDELKDKLVSYWEDSNETNT